MSELNGPQVCTCWQELNSPVSLRYRWWDFIVNLLKQQRSDKILWNANLMQQGDFINVFLARHVSGTYDHHQEHYMLSCSIWFSAPSFGMDGGLESRCVGRVCGAGGAARHHRHRTHCIKLAFHIISWRRCTVKQPSMLWYFKNLPKFSTVVTGMQ